MTRPAGMAKLPGLPSVSTGNPALDRWIQAVSERLEVREGTRGNPNERAVTLRELHDAGFSGFGGRGPGGSAGSVMTVGPDGAYTPLSLDDFFKKIRDSKLYKDLLLRLDDPSRFDDLPEQVRAILLTDLAEEARKRGADIQSLEYKLQSATESLAYTVQEVTASVEGSMAGVREMTFASADENRAIAGKVTQVTARLDNFSPDGEPGTASVEEIIKASVDRIDGVTSEYMIKVQANGAFGGFGLSAYAPADVTKPSYSQFLISADRFAIMGTGATPLIPFGINTATGQVYINGSLTINSGGDSFNTLLPATYKDYIFQRATGTTVPAKPTTTAYGAWTDAPPAGAGYLYMTVADRRVSTGALVGTWSNPVRIDGYEGAQTKYQYLVRATQPPQTDTGLSSPPGATLATGNFLWMRTGTVVPPATEPLENAWSEYVRISGEKGATGQGMVKGICFFRGDSPEVPILGGSFSNPNADGWSDGIPFDNGKPLWMTSQIFTSDGLAPAQGSWTEPSKVGSPSLVARPVFSVLGLVALIGEDQADGRFNEKWHVTPSVNDVFMATQAGVNGDFANGAITGKVRIKGEKGEKGDKGDAGADSTIPGAAGVRGTIVTKMEGAWSEVAANALIFSITTASGAMPKTPIRGDIVSHLGGAKEYNGSSWGNVAAYIDGSLIVTGTVGAGTGSFNRAVIGASGVYNGTNVSVAGGVFYAQASSGPLGTPLFTWAATDVAGVGFSLQWYDHSAVTNTTYFKLHAWHTATGLPWTGTLAVLNIWVY